MVSDRESLDKDVSDARAALYAGAAGASWGAAAGTGVAGTATAALLPPALVLVRNAIKRGRDTRESRAETAAKIAADIVGGIDIIERWTAADDVRFDLLVEVLEAAARTPLDVKIRALAEVLAEGLQTDGAAHEARIIAAALADIEAPHIDLLRFLHDRPLPLEEPIVPDQSTLTPLGWDGEQLRGALPHLALVLDGLIAVVAGHGLIKSQGGKTWATVGAASQYAITDLGRRCLFLLQFGTDYDEPGAP